MPFFNIRASRLAIVAATAAFAGTMSAAASPAHAAGAKSQGSTAVVNADWSCDSGGIVVTSTKDLSNVVLVIDGRESRVYEGSWAGKRLVLDPSAYGGTITGVFIKSGTNGSPKGGGKGEYVALTAPDCAPKPTVEPVTEPTAAPTSTATAPEPTTGTATAPEPTTGTTEPATEPATEPTTTEPAPTTEPTTDPGAGWDEPMLDMN